MFLRTPPRDQPPTQVPRRLGAVRELLPLVPRRMRKADSQGGAQHSSDMHAFGGANPPARATCVN